MSLTPLEKSLEEAILAGRLEDVAQYIDIFKNQAKLMSSPPSFCALNDQNENFLLTALKAKQPAIFMKLFPELESVVNQHHIIFAASNNGITVFHLAAQENYRDCMQLLLTLADEENSLAWTLTDTNGMTPLHLAFLHQSMDVANLLIKTTTAQETRETLLNQPDNTGNTVAHLLCQYFDMENENILIALLEGGASFEVVNNELKAPSMLLSSEDRVALFEKIVTNAFEINDRQLSLKFALALWEIMKENKEWDRYQKKEVNSCYGRMVLGGFFGMPLFILCLGPLLATAIWNDCNSYSRPLSFTENQNIETIINRLRDQLLEPIQQAMVIDRQTISQLVDDQTIHALTEQTGELMLQGRYHQDTVDGLVKIRTELQTVLQHLNTNKNISFSFFARSQPHPSDTVIELGSEPALEDESETETPLLKRSR